jgi:hypothetical protein
MPSDCSGCGLMTSDCSRCGLMTADRHGCAAEGHCMAPECMHALQWPKNAALHALHALHSMAPECN